MNEKYGGVQLGSMLDRSNTRRRMILVDLFWLLKSLLGMYFGVFLLPQKQKI